LIRQRSRDAWSSSLTARAKAELEKLGAGADVNPLAKLGTLDLVPQINPSYHRPVHLAPIVAELERSWDGPARATMHAPPQHGKTDTVSAFVVATLLRKPRTRFAYVTYEAHRAEAKSARIRAWSTQCGVKLDESSTSKAYWRTTLGGGLMATGIGGPLTGEPVDILLIDDPYRNRQQAESAAFRRMAEDWFGDVAETRIQPDGSMFVWHTRWHPADLIGFIKASAFASDFRDVSLKAISDAGLPLWPERYPLEVLHQKRRTAGPYTWASLYQGEPRPRGGTVFEQPVTCLLSEVPKTGTASIGVDLAYTKRTYADRSIALTLLKGQERDDGQPVYYVRDFIAKQCRAPEFVSDLKRIKASWPGAPMTWHCSGTEIGSADFIKDAGVPLKAKNAGADKFVRSQDVAAAWNDGRVIVPRDALWADELIGIVTGFTGVGDEEDDPVDALASAYDGFTYQAPQSVWIRGL
jgi:predicted phage terminase large subunit-like protein